MKWDQYGRKRQPVAEVFGAKVFNYFMHIVMNRLMESDRFVLGGGKSIFIGRTDKKKQSVVKYRKKKQLYFASRGIRYGVVLHGINHKYFFRMPSRRRMELKSRIQKGQNFYNQE